MTESTDEVEMVAEVDMVAHCPACGHGLSMFIESEPDADELWASKAIGIITNWRFPVGMVVLIVIWIAFNLIFEPFEEVIFMIATLAAAITTVSALQGPLILLTQRRAVERDRQRDRATHQVVSNTEHDVHAMTQEVRRLSAEVTALAKRLESGVIDPSASDSGTS